MGLFSGLFGGRNEAKKTEKQLPWIPLTGIAQLEDIEQKSTIRPQLIFKHSTTCGISRMVLRAFADSFDFENEELDLYYLDLHKFREVSNETGYKFQVVHQSPQLLIIKDGASVADASHGAITDMDIRSYI